MFIFFFAAAAAVCISNMNTSIPWYIIYKLPGEYGHFYADQANTFWKFSNTSMMEPSAVSNTLNLIYQNKTKLHIMYNDHTPQDVEYFRYGHAKGVLTDSFWFVHSVPLFPSERQYGYKWPYTANRNAQIFLCITTPHADKIAAEIIYNEIYAYDYSVPNPTPDLLRIMNHSVFSLPRNYSYRPIDNMMIFAKSKKFNKDLYVSLVAPILKSDLLVESWQRSLGYMTSNCTNKYKVFNIKSIAIQQNFFNETHDHSKWAITTTKYWTCIGDINRQWTQLRRGGGCVCLHNKKLWQIFNSTALSISACNN